jgi:hypothetical protein
LNKPHEVFELLGRIASPADLRALEPRLDVDAPDAIE